MSRGVYGTRRIQKDLEEEGETISRCRIARLMQLQGLQCKYQKFLDDHGFECSMSRKGDCWDNAPAKSFFHTLKTELVNHCQFATRKEAKLTIFEYIEVFYNRQRKHLTNGYLSPTVFEEQTLEVA